jgi:hypothetical protein
MNVKEEIKRAIKYGIFLGDLELEDEGEFLRELFSYLIERKNFCTMKDKDKTIAVSASFGELAEVFIHVGTLKVIPLSPDGYFKVFMDVLEFVAKKHEKEIERLKDPPKIRDDGDESTEEDWWL